MNRCGHRFLTFTDKILHYHGILAEKDRYIAYSKNPKTDYVFDVAPEMRMPHKAPTEGYLQEYQWEKTSGEQLTIDKKLGFFIKTRIKLDEKGNVGSSNYAKFISDVEIDIRGRIKFTPPISTQRPTTRILNLT